MRVLSQHDTVFYLAYHLLKHHNQRLSWCIDLCLAVTSLPASDDASLLMKARSEGLENLMLSSCALTAEVLSVQMPQAIETALEAKPRIVRIARRFADQQFAADRVQAVHRRFLLAIEANAWRRFWLRAEPFVPQIVDRRWAQQHGLRGPIASALLPFIRLWRMIHKRGVGASRSVFPTSML
jgi:hypothetical protein